MSMIPLSRKTIIRPCILGFGLTVLPSFHAQAATTVLDWLKLAAGGTVGNFTLRDDDPSAAAAGRAIVTSGAIFPGPTSRDLASVSWSSVPDFEDTLTGDALVSAFEIRVAPVGGLVNYSVEFLLQEGVPHYLMVADLFKSAGAGTSGATISALSDSGVFAVDFVGATGWSNGVKVLTQDVTWDSLTRTLAPAATANGETKPAFFSVAAMTGANPRIRIDIPSGYAVGGGDSLMFAVATVIPEPSQAILWVAGMGLLMSRRRRD